ncbi:protein phosphatase CheZ [Caldimonas tepidiphila]|uniref:protein phosphatase CheZ n=1 Tax=Caldimonas tepidiphila TaxID=2315841 RepID=UPI000E5B37EB|nr:protein phosphatase CheZ [Caldimonas tepidiphila]
MERPQDPAAPLTVSASPEVFQQLGLLTRQLHDTLAQLGVMPNLKGIAGELPDAKSRLNYIAAKTGEAADRVLGLVDQAKGEQGHIAAEARRVGELIVRDPVAAVAKGEVMNFVDDVEAASGRIDQHLTQIMMAQDFHDLTGQVIARVVRLASDLEDQLVKLLVQAAPPEQAQKVEAGFLNGPVVDATGRNDVVTNQGEVDDLLASLGF